MDLLEIYHKVTYSQVPGPGPNVEKVCGSQRDALRVNLHFFTHCISVRIWCQALFWAPGLLGGPSPLYQAVPSNTAATSHVWFFQFKLVKIK